MNNKILYSALLLILGVVSHSQEFLKKDAIKRFNDKKFLTSIAENTKLVDSGNNDKTVLENLANAYYMNDDYKNASHWYGELFKTYKVDDPESYYRYSVSLRSIQDFEGAKKMGDQFSQMKKDSRSSLLEKYKDFTCYKDSYKDYYKVDKISNNSMINSKSSDFGMAYLKDGKVFSSSRFNGIWTKHNSNWNNAIFYSMFYLGESADSKGSTKPHLLKFVKGKSKFDESSPVFTADGKKMFFTRGVRIKRTKRDTVVSKTVLKIYMSTLAENKKGKSGEPIWNEPTELSINGKDWNTGHPALNKEENVLYFSSDKPGTGGYGGSDIYKVDINENGVCGTPVNLGSAVNTSGNESFPFIGDNDDLYFSSNALPGFGGYDVFVSRVSFNGKRILPQNLGSPLNTESDDFALSSNEEVNGFRLGYFTSNRVNGQGADDIYKFVELKKMPLFLLTKTAITGTDKTVVDGVAVTLLEGDKVIDTVSTNKVGKLYLKIPSNKEYTVRFEKAKYETKNVPIKDLMNEDPYVEIELEKEKKSIESLAKENTQDSEEDVALDVNTKTFVGDVNQDPKVKAVKENLFKDYEDDEEEEVRTPNLKAATTKTPKRKADNYLTQGSEEDDFEGFITRPSKVKTSKGYCNCGNCRASKARVGTKKVKRSIARTAPKRAVPVSDRATANRTTSAKSPCNTCPRKKKVFLLVYSKEE